MTRDLTFGPPPEGPCPHGHMYRSSCPKCSEPERPMAKINPKYVDGEPVCTGRSCPGYQKNVIGLRFIVYTCKHYEAQREVLCGHICIPALKRDRDRYKEERDKLKCCGNCKHYRSQSSLDGCIVEKHRYITRGNRVCEKWEIGEDE